MLEILNNKDLGFYQNSVFSSLKNITNPEDIQKVEEIVMTYFRNKGKINPVEFLDYFFFLSQLAYRKVEGAKEKLMEMTNMNYWKKQGISFKERPGASKFDILFFLFHRAPTFYHDKLWLEAFGNKIIANIPEGKERENFKESLNTALKNPDMYYIKNPAKSTPMPVQLPTKEEIKLYEDYYRMYQLYKEGKIKLEKNGAFPCLAAVFEKYKIAEEKEAKEIYAAKEQKQEEAEIETFTDACDRIISGAGAAKGITPEEKELAEKTKKEALDAFIKIRDLFIAGSFDELDGKLLDDGKPLESGRIKSKTERVLSALKKQQPVLIAIKGMTPIDYRVGTSTKDSNIAVSFEYPNTFEIVKANFTRVRTDLTIANGRLIVFMRKIDEKWYWNPFGW